MKKRTLPALKLQKSPLVLVLCQVRFSPILAMADYFPKVQDSLRLKGYPSVKTDIVQETLFTPAGLTSMKKSRWRVFNKDLTESIVVTEDFIVFQTTKYTVFENFVQKLAEVMETLASVVKQLAIQRIGLRYIDLIRPRANETWRNYVRPELHGLSNAVLKPDTQLQLQQTVANTERGTLITRLYQNREGQIFPPDLTDDSLTANLTPLPDQGELLTLIDLDHFCTVQCDYEPAQLEDIVWQLHDDIDRVFRESVVTPSALKAWE